MEKCQLSLAKKKQKWQNLYEKICLFFLWIGKEWFLHFAVFPYIKSFLQGTRFDNLSELRQAVMNVIVHMKTDQFVQIFDDTRNVWNLKVTTSKKVKLVWAFDVA